VQYSARHESLRGGDQVGWEVVSVSEFAQRDSTAWGDADHGCRAVGERHAKPRLCTGGGGGGEGGGGGGGKGGGGGREGE